MAVATEQVLSGGLPYRVVGAQRETITNVTFDNSYASGGEPLAVSALGLNVLDGPPVVTVLAGTESATVRVSDVSYVTSTEKLKAIDNATGKEVEAGKDLSKVVVQVVARGK